MHVIWSLVCLTASNPHAVLVCSSDVSRGLQSTARSVQLVETTIRQGAGFVEATTKEKVLPAIRSRVPAARGETQYTMYSFQDCQMRFKIWTQSMDHRLQSSHLASTLIMQVSMQDILPAREQVEQSRIQALRIVWPLVQKGLQLQGSGIGLESPVDQKSVVNVNLSGH